MWQNQKPFLITSLTKKEREADRLFSLLAGGDPCLSLLKYRGSGRLSCEGCFPELTSIQQIFTKHLLHARTSDSNESVSEMSKVSLFQELITWWARDTWNYTKNL